MSEAVRAAVAARRSAAARSRSTSPVKQRRDGLAPMADDTPDDFIQSFGSPRKSPSEVVAPSLTPSMDDVTLAQRSEEELLFKSCTTGKLNISSRLPALTTIPSRVFTLLDGEAPQWYEMQSELDRSQQRRPWYEREDLKVLAAANGEITQIPDRIGEFRGLSKLELQNNHLTSVPATTFQLVNLTTLNLSRNAFTSVPPCLLALDSLIELDLSHNKLDSLWSDEAVSQARQERKQWDQENADEEDGVWAGFLERAGSPTKRIRPPPPASQQEQIQPMRSLRILKLSNNRLGNASLGLTQSRQSTSQHAKPFTWPPALVELDISDNALRGPLPLSLLGHLKELRSLSLGGNGLADEVFHCTPAADSPKTPFGPPRVFAKLHTLDLQRCEIDDLASLEQTFGSPTTLFNDGKDSHPGSTHTAAQNEMHPGLTRRNLVRVRQSKDAEPQTQSVPGTPTLADSSAAPKALYIVLEGNPLREETFKRKHGIARRNKIEQPTTDRSPSAREDSTNVDASSHKHSAVAQPIATPPTPASLSPSKSNEPAKEDWELQIEAGMYSEGAKRRMRAEAARAAAAAANTDPSPSLAPQSSPSPSRARVSRQQDGINKTGLSEWDGTPPPTKSQLRQQRQQNGEPSLQQRPSQGNGDHSTTHTSITTSNHGSAASTAASGTGSGAGSTLANAKLTKKQSEALGRVPCKFFRSANGCSAGDACPFAHVLPGAVPGDGSVADGSRTAGSTGVGVKSVCEFFIKGNCRFGHKCALAHVREGEPMSMDRKNKKAAQLGQRGAKNGTQVPSQAPQPPFQAQYQQQQQHSQPFQAHQIQQSQRLQPQQQYTQHFSSVQHPSQTAARPFPQHQHPQPHTNVGMPLAGHQQQQLHPQAAVDDWPSAYPANGNLPPREDFTFGLPDDLQSAPPLSTTSGIGRSLSGSVAPGQHRNSLTGPHPNGAVHPASFVGSPSTTRAFGSSPFGQSVFFSGSQESEGGAGPFGRSVGSTSGSHHHPAGRSILGGRNGSFSGSMLRPQMDRLGEHGSRYSGSGLLHEDEAEELDDGDVDDGHNEEDFLPSSLSDLLTPAELERRKRSAAVGAAGRHRTTTQSMPAEGAQGTAAFQAGVMDLQHRSALGGVLASTMEEAADVSDELMHEPLAFDKRNTHAPGQSLPRGLAAGLSRLHVSARSNAQREQEVAGRQNGSGQQSLEIPVSTAQHRFGKSFGSSGVPFHSGSPSVGTGAGGISALGRTLPRQEFGPVGSPSTRSTRNGSTVLGGSSSLEDYGLGPTAPSSVLAPRPGGLSSRLSSTFSYNGTPTSGFGYASQSPGTSLGAIGSGSSPAGTAATAGKTMASYASAASGGTTSSVVAQGYLHPGAGGAAAYQGKRSSLSGPPGAAAAASSPLALPPSSAEDEEEVGVFELE